MTIRKPDYLTLATSDNVLLEEFLLGGVRPEAGQLAGWEFKGFNTLDLAALAGFRRFKKGFYQEGDQLRGYNVKVNQGGLINPWVDIVKNGNSVKHGWYDVYPVRAEEADNLYPNALLLNYASGRNPAIDPSSLLRDYLVQVDPENPDLLLGKAFGSLGSRRIFLSFFVLERENESTL